MGLTTIRMTMDPPITTPEVVTPAIPLPVATSVRGNKRAS